MAAKKPNDRATATSIDGLFKNFSKMGITAVERIEKVERIPTGILSLDMVLHGGLPKGRMVYHYGEEGSGKTTQWLLIARNLMQRHLPVLWIDAERTLEREYPELLGLDVDAVDLKGNPLLRVIKVQTAQQGMDAMVMALELGAFAMIVVDTLAKLVPDVEASSSVSKMGMGDASRLYSRATRVWSRALDESGTVLVVLNQERLDLGAYGAPKTSPGGKAITKHEPSIILHSGRNANEYHVDIPGRPSKIVLRYTIKKSKVFKFAMQFKTDDYHQLHIRTGDVYEIDYPHEMYVAALALGLLLGKDGQPWKVNNAFFEGEVLANGDKAMQAFFDTVSPLRDRIEQAIHKRMEGGNFGTQGTTGTVHDNPTGEAGLGEREVEADADQLGDL